MENDKLLALDVAFSPFRALSRRQLTFPFCGELVCVVPGALKVSMHYFLVYSLLSSVIDLG